MQRDREASLVLCTTHTISRHRAGHLQLHNFHSTKTSSSSTTSKTMSTLRVKASAAFKKQDGEISLSEDRKSILWSASGSSGATTKIATSELTSMISLLLLWQ